MSSVRGSFSRVQLRSVAGTATSREVGHADGRCGKAYRVKSDLSLSLGGREDSGGCPTSRSGMTPCPEALSIYDECGVAQSYCTFGKCPRSSLNFHDTASDGPIPILDRTIMISYRLSIFHRCTHLYRQVHFQGYLMIHLGSLRE